jgi:hypothetical protein
MVSTTTTSSLIVACMTATVAAATASTASNSQQQKQSQPHQQHLRSKEPRDYSTGPKGEFVEFPRHHRDLQASFDFFDASIDLCDNSPNPIEDRPSLGLCDTSRFPTCGGRDEEQICYNRKFSRDHFHADTHQHQYYIQYDRVFCYPEYWGGCSSCTPGRYCVSEKRCILDELDYPCEQWF